MFALATVKSSFTCYATSVGLPPALKKVSLRIEGGERIGVVGPSGAGKSSLLVLLFRLLDPHTGRVLIDGVDTRDVGLLTLRHSMAIIPQSPLLLEDTVRKNLDPFDDHSTAELKKVLSAVGLSPNLLDDDSDSCDTQSEDGPKKKKVLVTSLSSGEKQMLNLARAMLFPHIRVLVCDEPTSNIDMTTDRKVQKVSVDSCLYSNTKRKSMVMSVCMPCKTTMPNLHTYHCPGLRSSGPTSRTAQSSPLRIASRPWWITTRSSS